MWTNGFTQFSISVLPHELTAHALAQVPFLKDSKNMYVVKVKNSLSNQSLKDVR